MSKPSHTAVAERVDYSKAVTPANYKCHDCGATGCKLWRDYNSFGSTNLKCARCAAVSQGKNIDDIDAAGGRSGKYGGRTDQIGWYVPAVPDEEGAGYWGYTSVTQAGCDWWKRLPTLPPSP